MGWDKDFEELSDELNGFAQKFKREARRDPETGQYRSEDSELNPKARIDAGMRTGITEDIVPEAKRRASQYVPPRAVDSIEGFSGSWNNHYLIATNDLVKYHEYGTGTKATDPRKGTTNAPDRSGYIIPSDGYPVTTDSGMYGPENFPAALEQLGADFEYVVHPGVKAQRFMWQAVLDNKHKLGDRVADEFEKFGETFK